MNPVERKWSLDEARCAEAYEMELARGASHIASMLYEDGIRAAFRETVLLFEDLHGRNDLKIFVHVLLGKLEQRGKEEAVKVLQEFLSRGRLQPISSGPLESVSARRPVTRKSRSSQNPKTKSRKSGSVT
jgi:hypothetical protein